MMGEKYIKIDLMKYIPLSSYVCVDKEFKEFLFRKALFKAGNETRLSRILKIERRTLSTWRLGKRKRMPLNALLGMAQYLGLKEDEVRTHILEITSYFDAGLISVKDWKMLLTEEFSEWFGLIIGDGCLAPYGVWCHNTSLEILLFFAKVCENTFGVDKDRIRIVVRIPEKPTCKDYKYFSNLFLNLGYSNVHKDTLKQNDQKKVLFSFYVGSKLFSTILKGIMKDIKEILNNSVKSVKAGYVCGFASAEGCVHKKKIFLVNKNKEELEFIKNLMSDIGITSIGPKLKPSGVFHLRISGRINLLKFYNFIGFGRQKQRNQKLLDVINNYVNKPEKERSLEILNLVKSMKKATIKSISTKIDIKDKRVGFILRGLVKRRLVRVDKTRKSYLYSSVV